MTTRNWKQGFLAMPGVGVSLLPKLMCPACWPAYAGILSSLGLGFLISASYLFYATAAFLGLAVGSLWFRASQRRGLRPFWIGLLAAGVILTGKFYLDAAAVVYGGAGLLVAASVWNAWPRRTRVALICRDCIPAGGGSLTRNAEKGERV